MTTGSPIWRAPRSMVALSPPRNGSSVRGRVCGAPSGADEADREWLIAQLDGRLLDDEELRGYERAPDDYLPVDALHSLIKRNFAPLDSSDALGDGARNRRVA